MRSKCKKRACNRELIGFNDKWLRLIGIPLLALIIPVVFFKSEPLTDFSSYIKKATVSLIYVIIYWEIDRLIILYFRKKITDYRENTKRLLLQGTLVLLLTLFLCTVMELIFGSLFDLIDDRTLQPKYTESVLVSLISTTVIISLYESRYYFNQYKSSIIKNEALQKENTKAQLQTLKNQINPHFLFNSLNTLMALIPENPETAMKFVENLSKVYRYILEIKEKNYITLGEEMKCNEAFEFLLKIRFGDNIIFNKSGLNGNINRYIIPLSVQLLIENAVKHNVISKTNPLTISIEASDSFIIVKNNLQLKNRIEPSTKTGLKNIQKRYELLSNAKIEIEQTTTYFQVKLPLIKISNAL